MKKLMAGFAFIVFAGLIHAQAQQTPVVDKRQEIQRHRIQDGVSSGELTRREAASARHAQRRIKRAERRSKADGVVTGKERARLDHKQDKASRDLRRAKHDAQDRPLAN